MFDCGQDLEYLPGDLSNFTQHNKGSSKSINHEHNRIGKKKSIICQGLPVVLQKPTCGTVVYILLC